MHAPRCVALSPRGVPCQRPMKFVREAWYDRRRRHYVFQCPWCQAVRVLADR